MIKILAVSGGVDSMVMLDWLHNVGEVAVAHFNHGTRPSADDDAAFVKRIAHQYNLPFVSAKANLGPNVSEANARIARYKFLGQVARKYHGEIYTAHHLDDLVESVAINLTRGTGWRGLAVLDMSGIKRPLISWSRRDILKYAAEHRITYRQDPTNAEPTYLRNRLRPAVAAMPDDAKHQIYELWQQQKSLKSDIDSTVAELLSPNQLYDRSWLSDLDDHVAIEVLRAALLHDSISATRPQLNDFLTAIRTYSPGKQFNLPGGKLIKISDIIKLC